MRKHCRPCRLFLECPPMLPPNPSPSREIQLPRHSLECLTKTAWLKWASGRISAGFLRALHPTPLPAFVVKAPTQAADSAGAADLSDQERGVDSEGVAEGQAAEVDSFWAVNGRGGMST